MFYKIVQRPEKLLKSPKLLWEFYVFDTLNVISFKIRKRKLKTNSVWGRKIHTKESANRLIYNGIMADKPFFVCRCGNRELRIVLMKELKMLGAVNNYSETLLEGGQNNAGIFPPTTETADYFADIYAQACGYADVNVYWGHIFGEKFLMDKYAKNAEIIPSRPLEPFEFERPWTAALKGKKVLVIHPFADTIEKQYAKRDRIHKNPDILPEFELKTIKAVQSSAGVKCGFNNWKEAFEYMKAEIDKTDFDVALLGCGGYAVPLAAHIKQKGKKTVVTGGFTQILFGIKGERWERSRPDIVAMYNDSWVRPDEVDKPEKSDSVEENAYW